MAAAPWDGSARIPQDGRVADRIETAEDAVLHDTVTVCLVTSIAPLLVGVYIQGGTFQMPRILLCKLPQQADRPRLQAKYLDMRFFTTSSSPSMDVAQLFFARAISSQ